jgi:murein DD-endopeptidase MepM/ murein hydrolase activator NlpD
VVNPRSSRSCNAISADVLKRKRHDEEKRVVRSIKVRLHDHAHRGDVLALLGNGGNTTDAHLHLQVSDRNSVPQSEGLPFVFESFTYLGPGSEYELDKHVPAPWVNSIPPGGAVIEFEPVKK